VLDKNNKNKNLERFGFGFARGGVHTSRTMMLAELQSLLSFVANSDAPKSEYLDAIQTANCLGKRSGKTRVLTILNFHEGATISRVAVEEFIDHLELGRFSKATLKSTAQNINSSWTQSGHLSGRARKIRERTIATPGSVSLALLMGYLNGLRGESLLSNHYTRLLDCSFEKTIELAEDASRRGWISLKRVGQVVEVLFPNLITAQEMEWLREQN
jgi:hypothetical protein